MGILRKERAAGRGGGFVLGLAAIGLTAMFLLAGRMFGFIDFGSTEIDRSQPPLLVQLSDLAEYRAASSNFELIVDLEKDVKFLPALVAGERSVMVVAGTVDAKVDFSMLTEQNIVVTEDRKGVVVHLPTPEIADPRVDNERTEVVARQRGLLTRIGGVFSDQPINDQKLYVLAEQKLRVAAQESQLRDLAEKNTRSMLETLLRSLGFEQISIIFDPPSVAG
ncbi:MAG TPA: DUF4230 domain-containing protein [Acidimicrobiales bacterium]|nr:DUF4230 domain-containing protein [Acidimicrobiales bacterium]